MLKSTLTQTHRNNNNDDLLFTVTKSKSTKSIYVKVWHEFDRLLKIVDMADKKEGEGGGEEFIYYQERWEGKDWRGVPLNPVGEQLRR